MMRILSVIQVLRRLVFGTLGPRVKPEDDWGVWGY